MKQKFYDKTKKHLTFDEKITMKSPKSEKSVNGISHIL